MSSGMAFILIVGCILLVCAGIVAVRNAQTRKLQKELELHQAATAGIRDMIRTVKTLQKEDLERQERIRQQGSIACETCGHKEHRVRARRCAQCGEMLP